MLFRTQFNSIYSSIQTIRYTVNKWGHNFTIYNNSPKDIMRTTSTASKVDVNGGINAIKLGSKEHCIDTAYIENIKSCSPIHLFADTVIVDGELNGISV